MSASVNLPLHHKVQKFSSGTGSPGWSQKKGHKTVVCVCVRCMYTYICMYGVFREQEILHHDEDLESFYSSFVALATHYICVGINSCMYTVFCICQCFIVFFQMWFFVWHNTRSLAITCYLKSCQLWHNCTKIAFAKASSR